MKKLTGDRLTIVIAILMLLPFSFFANLLMRYYAKSHNPVILEGPLDPLFQVIPIFAIPYLSMLPLALFITPLMSLVYGSYKKFLKNGCAVFIGVICLIIGFLLLPTERPHGYDFPEHLSFSEKMLHLAYQGLSPIWNAHYGAEAVPITSGYNSFPSGHALMVAITILAWLQLRHRFPVWTAFVIAWCVLVLFSTLFVHEHHIIELYAGLFVGFFAYSMSSLLIDRLLPKEV